MGLLSSLFGNGSKKKTAPAKETAPPENLQDIFETDLKNPDISSFSNKQEDENRIHYFKSFSKKEAGIFTQLEVIDIQNSTGKNFVFTNKNPRTVTPKDVKMLVANLYVVYGEDDKGNGFLSKEEENELSERDFYWTGRSWTKSQNGNPSLRFDGDNEEGYGLTIWTK